MGREAFPGRRRLSSLLIKSVIFMAAVVLATATTALAETERYPSRPVTILCWSAPGSPVDVMARKLAASIEPILGVPVRVVNKLGGSGVVAVNALLEAPADGYTLLAATRSLTELFIRPETRLSPSDVQPIIGVQQDPYALIVRGDSKFRSLKELVEWALANPGRLTVAGPFAGGGHQVAFWQFQQLSGIKVTWVPFQGGALVVQAVLGGHTMAGQTNPGIVRSLVEEGKLRILAVSSDKRLKHFPDVPTYREQGYDFVDSHYRGIVAKAGTPPQIVATLYNAFKQAILSPGFTEYLDENDQLPWPITGEEYAKVMRADMEASVAAIAAVTGK